MRAVLVDDEKESLLLLELMISKHVPDLTVVAACNDPVEAISKIRSLKPEVVLLDVEMPNLNGFELLDQLPLKDFSTIITTSHERFALKALKAGAVDYLIKPIQVEDLKQSIAKIASKRATDPALQLEMLLNHFKPARTKARRIALTAADHLMFVDTADVVYCESDSNYTTFYLLTGEKVVISKTLKDVEEILAGDDFFRIHASYLVNMKHVTKFTRGDGGFVVMSNNQQLAVSRRKKDEFFEMFSKL